MMGKSLVVTRRIEQAILVLRGERVMLDCDLAVLYGVTTKALNQAVRRNRSRFPVDFMFQLTLAERRLLRSQHVTSNDGRGGRRYAPYAFTKQDVAMLSTVLRSPRAIHVNIEIMRTFVFTSLPGGNCAPGATTSKTREGDRRSIQYRLRRDSQIDSTT
jgi:ORF6N domain-containing protein